MNRRVLPALLLATGCATTPPPPPEEPKAPKEVLITNRYILDVAACQPSSAQVPLSTNDTVAGAQYYSYAAVNECLADPKHRGPEEQTTLVLTTQVTAQGVEHKARGTNVTPEGLKCLEDAATRHIRLPPLEKNGRPAQAEMELMHQKGISSNPFIVFGVNEASDIIGTLRLASASMCECYAPFTQQAPPALRAWVRLPRGSTTISEVRWVQRGGDFPKPPPPPPAAEGAPAEGAPAQPPAEAAPTWPADFTPEQRTLAECLEGKMKQVQMRAPASFRWDLPHDFEFVNSRTTQVAANATPDLSLDHLESARVEVQADKTVAYGMWTEAASRFEVLPQTYRKNDKKARQRLMDACTPMPKASQRWVETIEKQLAVDKRMLEIAQAGAATNPSYAPLTEQYSGRVAATEKLLGQAREVLRTDVERCQKL